MKRRLVKILAWLVVLGLALYLAHNLNLLALVRVIHGA